MKKVNEIVVAVIGSLLFGSIFGLLKLVSVLPQSIQCKLGNHPDMIDGVDELEGDVVVSTTGKCSHCGEVYIRENFWTM